MRADVVRLAPDVSGLVSQVLVHDNEEVHAGDVIFRIDQARYRLAMKTADAKADLKAGPSGGFPHMEICAIAWSIRSSLQLLCECGSS